MSDTYYARTDYGTIVAQEFTAREHHVVIHVLEDPALDRQVPQDWRLMTGDAAPMVLAQVIAILAPLAAGGNTSDIRLLESRTPANPNDHVLEVWVP